MNKEMIAALASYFAKKGVMDRNQYRNATDAPYTLKEVEKEFTKYSAMLFQVSQYTLPEKVEVKKEEVVENTPKVTTTIRRQSTKIKAKEVSLDG